MLSPARVKHRRSHKGNMKGSSIRGNDVSFGDYALMAVNRGWLTARQIEAARIAMTRKVKRGGKIWIRVFPDKPYTKKPAEVRMGKGKGATEGWVAVVVPGRILYEMNGVDRETAKAALTLAASKLPIATKILVRDDEV